MINKRLRYKVRAQKRQRKVASLNNRQAANINARGSFVLNRSFKFDYDKYEVDSQTFIAGSSYGIDNGPISKLFIVDKETKEEVYNYERGQDINKIDQSVLTGIIKYIYSQLKNYYQQHSDDEEVKEYMEIPGSEEMKWMKDASTNTDCHIYKASNGKWYAAVGDGEYRPVGPFNDEEEAYQGVVERFGNPGGYSRDNKGTVDPPQHAVL